MASCDIKALLIQKTTALINEDFNEDGKMPSGSEIQKQFGKIWKEATKTSTKKDKKVVEKVEKPKRQPTRYNPFAKEQMARMKDEDKDKSKEEKRSSQEMMKEISQL